jgi:5-formyltetrahydrofolate cyclo-ligase
MKTKKEIRADALKRRDALSDAERDAKSLVICERIMEDDRFIDADGVHVYFPINSEVDIMPLISMAWGMGKAVGIMRIEEDGGTSHHHITAETAYAPGPLGIQQPMNAKPYDMDLCDLVIVPLVAADAGCHRVGYGKGYYDQFLMHFPRPTLGVAFDVQIYDAVPTDPLDITLDRIVTETRAFDC